MRSPCFDCQYEKECSDGKACRVFLVWINTGKINDKVRTPSISCYKKIFGFEGREN